MPEPKLVTTGAAARELGVDQSTLNRWAEQEKVTPAVTTGGGHRRWDMDDLRRQLRRSEEDVILEPLRAAFTHVIAAVSAMNDPHLALVVVAKLVPTLQAMFVEATNLRGDIVHRIYQQQELALKPLADRVSISETEQQRKGR